MRGHKEIAATPPTVHCQGLEKASALPRCKDHRRYSEKLQSPA
jgi:hypothetical protein